MQWIIYPDENKTIQKFCKNRFYLLRANQVLLENAFTFQQYREVGLFPAISYDLLQKAKNEGYSRAITYINNQNISAINEFIKLGFKIRKRVREYKILGKTKRMLRFKIDDGI